VVGSYATLNPLLDGLCHDAEMTGHDPEIGGHAPEMIGHDRPEYASTYKNSRLGVPVPHMVTLGALLTFAS